MRFRKSDDGFFGFLYLFNYYFIITHFYERFILHKRRQQEIVNIDRNGNFIDTIQSFWMNMNTNFPEIINFRVLTVFLPNLCLYLREHGNYTKLKKLQLDA